MKRSTVFIAFVLFLFSAHAQPVLQASIGAGSTPNKVKIFIRPISAVSGQISTMNFNIAIPDGVAPTPLVSIASSQFAGAGFQIQTGLLSDGYQHYYISNQTPFNLVLGAGVETEVFELNFDNGTSNNTTVRLVTLPDGGFPPFHLFYATGAAVTNGTNLYYTRAGTTVNNQFSYTHTPFGAPAGVAISFAELSSLVVLPIKWLSFDAVRQNNDALLTWTVSHESFNHHYVVERSLNGLNFTAIGTVNKTGSGDGVRSYIYTDIGITSLGRDVIYYRLQQVDIDGRNSLSDIRQVKLGKGRSAISIYPNPAIKGFYVNVPLEGPGSEMVKITLFSNSGQLVQVKTISSHQATNYFFDIAPLSLAAGQYQVTVMRSGETLKTTKLIVNRE